MKEAMGQNKRGMPVVHPSRKEGNQYALVFNQKGEILAPLRVVNLVAFPDKRTKDTSHASFFLRIKSIHNKKTSAGNMHCIPLYQGIADTKCMLVKKWLETMDK